ncbi:hypothetical protein B4U80_14260 [Leptotrombidium deliense]|uniref:Uncharacterized protein n=1 Tax=Leptotrombidium deliense TaxID=299467 RepID=A0A443RZ32_9ACAR|nr:hypothetical protein B4U80_14260 [Leptotrombidium deliense]
MLQLIFIGFFFTLVCVFLFICKSKNDHIAIPGPKRLPLIGTCEVLIIGAKNALKFVLLVVWKLMRKYGKEFKERGFYFVKIFHYNAVFITKPSLIKNFYEKYNSFLEQSILLQVTEIFAHESILAALPDLWKLKRKFYSPAFKTINLRRYETVINRETVNIINAIDCYKGKEFDIREIIEKHSDDY